MTDSWTFAKQFVLAIKWTILFGTAGIAFGVSMYWPHHRAAPGYLGVGPEVITAPIYGILFGCIGLALVLLFTVLLFVLKSPSGLLTFRSKALGVSWLAGLAALAIGILAGIAYGFVIDPIPPDF